MALIKRNNIYHYRFMYDKKLYRGSTRKAVKEEAEKFVKEIKDKIKSNNDASIIIANLKKQLVKEQLKLDKVWEVFQKTMPNNCKQYTQSFEARTKLLVNFAKEKKYKFIHEISSTDANAFIAQLKEDQFSQRTIKDYVGMYNQIFNYCKTNGYIFENPFGEIKIRGIKKDTVHREAFTPQELKLIGEHSKTSYLYPLFITGISTGLREGDMCNLKWSEIDLKENCIKKQISKTKEIVYIPILPGLYSYFIELDKKDIFVFPVLNKIYNRRKPTIGHDVTKLLTELGIETTRNIPGRKKAVSVKDIHSLRHTFAYLAAIHNVPFTIVQSILGHLDANMTKMYMNHSTIEAKQKMLKKLPNYLHPEEIEIKINIKSMLQKMNSQNWEQIRDKLLKNL